MRKDRGRGEGVGEGKGYGYSSVKNDILIFSIADLHPSEVCMLCTFW